MENYKVRLIWKCKKCKDVVISYSHLRHDMNYCDCGGSAVDLEKFYQRGMGEVKEISRKIYKDNKWVNVIKPKKQNNPCIIKIK